MILEPDVHWLLGRFLLSPDGAALADVSQQEATFVLTLGLAADHIVEGVTARDADYLHELAPQLPGVWSDTEWLVSTLDQTIGRIEDEPAGRLDLDEDEDDGLAFQAVAGLPGRAATSTAILMAFLGFDFESDELDDYIEEQIRLLAAHHETVNPEEAFARGLTLRTGGLPGALSLRELVESVSFEQDGVTIRQRALAVMKGLGKLAPNETFSTASVARDPEVEARLILAVSERRADVGGWVVPEDEIDEAVDVALAQLSGASFGFWFTHDMPPERWPAALLLTALTGARGASKEQFAEHLETFEASFRNAGVELDARRALGCFGAWDDKRVPLDQVTSIDRSLSGVTVFCESD